MGKLYKWLFLLTASFLFYACNTSESKQHKNLQYSFLDSLEWKIDTVLSLVQLDSQKVSILLSRAKLDEHLDPFDTSLASPIRLVIFNDSSNQPLYIKSFETEPDDYPYVSANIFKANGASLQDSGHLFFTLEKGYGGSGSSYQLYWIQSRNQKVQLKSVFKGSGELSYPYFLKQGNQILLFEAIWNMQAGEAHFADHGIRLTKIDLSKNEPVLTLLGVSRHKYQIPDSDLSAKALLEQFKLQEEWIIEL